MKGVASSGGRNCPEPEFWVRLAAGLCDPEQNSSLLDHAARCSFCADLLRDVLDAVAEGDAADAAVDPSTPTVAIGSEENRRELAAAMAANKGFRRRRWFLPIAAMLVIGLGLGVWVFTNRSGSPPLRQLAAAYSARRNLELQIPGAGYAPIGVERGAGPSLSVLPPALLENQIYIKKRL